MREEGTIPNTPLYLMRRRHTHLRVKKPDAMSKKASSAAKSAVEIPVELFDRVTAEATEAFCTLRTYSTKEGEVRKATTEMEALPFILIRISEKEIKGQRLHEAMIRFEGNKIFKIILEWGGMKLFRKVTLNGVPCVVPVKRAGIQPSKTDPSVGTFFVA